jgi:hypothetical protein
VVRREIIFGHSAGIHSNPLSRALVARLTGTLCAGRRKQVVARKAVPRRSTSRAGGISSTVAVAEARIRFDRDLVDHPP